MKSSGLVHVYYGNGKGKTTAALGLALRAYGQGFQVVLLQFLKGVFSGEIAALEKLPGIKIMRGENGKFLSAMSPAEKEEARKLQSAQFRQAVSLAKAGACDMLVLDEAMDACQLQIMDESLLKDFLLNKPEGLEVVITGHQMIPWILERADYATEMVKRKHPYDRGIKGRKGIEY